jgi:hypothetical protein
MPSLGGSRCEASPSRAPQTPDGSRSGISRINPALGNRRLTPWHGVRRKARPRRIPAVDCGWLPGIWRTSTSRMVNRPISSRPRRGGRLHRGIAGLLSAHRDVVTGGWGVPACATSLSCGDHPGHQVDVDRVYRPRDSRATPLWLGETVSHRWRRRPPMPGGCPFQSPTEPALTCTRHPIIS